MDSANETALALIPITLNGALLNWSILFAIRKLSFFNNSFGYLSANQAFFDGLHSTVFLLYFCPMVLLDDPTMKHYAFIIGFILIFCYEGSILCHLLISINRCCAAWMPMRYDYWFSIKNTKKMIVLIWILEAGIAIVFYQALCQVLYLEDIHFIQFTDSEFCAKVAWYEDFVKNAALVAIIVCLDITTILRVHHITKKIRSLNGQDANKFSARDIRFLKQTVFQGSVFLLELLTYFFIPQYFQNKWIIFFATSFAWVAIHAADGMVVIVCNPEVRNYLWRKKEVPQAPATETAVIIMS